MWGLLIVCFHPWAHIVQLTQKSPRATVWVVKWVWGFWRASRHFMKCRRCCFIATRISFSFCGSLRGPGTAGTNRLLVQGGWLARQITIIVSSINRVAFQLFFLKLDGANLYSFQIHSPKVCQVLLCDSGDWRNKLSQYDYLTPLGVSILFISGCSGSAQAYSGSAEVCSPSAQVKAAAAHVQRLKWNRHRVYGYRISINNHKPISSE